MDQQPRQRGGSRRPTTGQACRFRVEGNNPPGSHYDVVVCNLSIPFGRLGASAADAAVIGGNGSDSAQIDDSDAAALTSIETLLP